MQQIVHPERCETDDDIVKHVVWSLKDAFAKFAEIINEIGQKTPLLVFIEDETEDIDTKLKKIVERASISYQKVDDVDTAMTANSLSNISQRTKVSASAARLVLEQMSPQQRLITPQEVAQVVLMLAADSSSGITGQAINIDGGAVMS